MNYFEDIEFDIGVLKGMANENYGNVKFAVRSFGTMINQMGLRSRNDFIFWKR